ncbi:hypothetical protein H9P43_005705 [Blastocladiella emersonii ATCC 22665]|nr:hypothetical protein H9P43_005705 [Blastocladiella emersonii ATCC 22665]
MPVLRDFGLFSLESKDHVGDVLEFAQRHLGDNEGLLDMLEVVVASEKPRRAARRRARLAAMFTEPSDGSNFLPAMVTRACRLLELYTSASPSDQERYDWDGGLVKQICDRRLGPVFLGIMIMAQVKGRVGRHVFKTGLEENGNGGMTCGECNLVQQVEWRSTLDILLRFAGIPNHGPVLPNLPPAAKECIKGVLRRRDVVGDYWLVPNTDKHGNGRCVQTIDDMMVWTIAAINRADGSFLDGLRRESESSATETERPELTELEVHQAIMNRALSLIAEE